MPLAFPSTPTLSQEYIDPNGLVWKYNGFAWEPYLGSATRTFFGAKVKVDSIINLSSTEILVAFTSEEFDTNNLYNSNRFTANESGYYRINANFFTSTNGAGNSYLIRIKKNGNIIVDYVSLGANQSGVFDNTIFLANGEYIEFYASESTATGSLTVDTRVGFYLLGASPGTSTFSNSNLFSGAKVKLTSPKNLTNANTPIPWDSTEFNLNADSTGNVYWTGAQSSNVKIYTTGYYRVQFYIGAGSGGSNDGYKINFKKNTTILENGTISPNDVIDYDSILYLTNGDVLQIEASESGSAGSVITDSFLSISRTGV